MGFRMHPDDLAGYMRRRIDSAIERGHDPTLVHTDITRCCGTDFYGYLAIDAHLNGPAQKPPPKNCCPTCGRPL